AASDVKQARSRCLPLLLRAEMQPAFLLLLVLPPPPPCARMLAGLDGAGAWRAADRNKTAGMQRIDRDIVLGDVSREPVRRPIRDRLDLGQRMIRIPYRERHVGPLVGMLTAKAGDPASCALELAIERPHFADFAAGLAVLDRLAKAEHAVTIDQTL